MKLWDTPRYEGESNMNRNVCWEPWRLSRMHSNLWARKVMMSRDYLDAPVCTVLSIPQWESQVSKKFIPTLRHALSSIFSQTKTKIERNLMKTSNTVHGDIPEGNCNIWNAQKISRRLSRIWKVPHALCPWTSLTEENILGCSRKINTSYAF